MEERYVALKVQKSAQHYTEAAMDEITILQRIADGEPEDKKCVVKLLDHFKHSSPNGQNSWGESVVLGPKVSSGQEDGKTKTSKKKTKELKLNFLGMHCLHGDKVLYDFQATTKARGKDRCAGYKIGK